MSLDISKKIQLNVLTGAAGPAAQFLYHYPKQFIDTAKEHNMSELFSECLERRKAFKLHLDAVGTMMKVHVVPYKTTSDRIRFSKMIHALLYCTQDLFLK